MKASNATSAPAAANAAPENAAKPKATAAIARPSASSPTATSLAGIEVPVGGFPLAGPSDLPDPRTHAYRQDLADVSLAGRVIASHYAEPLERRLTGPSPLLASPIEDAEVLVQLPAGATLDMLDASRGWAWGYAGPERLVGYVRSEAVGRG